MNLNNWGKFFLKFAFLLLSRRKESCGLIEGCSGVNIYFCLFYSIGCICLSVFDSVFCFLYLYMIYLSLVLKGETWGRKGEGVEITNQFSFEETISENTRKIWRSFFFNLKLHIYKIIVIMWFYYWKGGTRFAVGELGHLYAWGFDSFWHVMRVVFFKCMR